MTSDAFDKQIARERADGWRIKERGENWALLHKPDFGTKDGHVLLAAVTVWWTFGLANLAYALLEYWYDTPTKMIEAGETFRDEASTSVATAEVRQSNDDADPSDAPDPLTILRERYARGEIDEAEFERRVERLLETESIEAARRRGEREREPTVERS
jgi:hypothetical protein